PSQAMMVAMDAKPLGGRSIVTKQFSIPSLARYSDSLDSISDEEGDRRGAIVRSHIKPNKNSDSFAEIRAQRIPQPPHDHTKPAVMKYPDLPSKPIIPNRPEGGSGRKKTYSASGSLSTLSSVSDLVSSSDSYSPSCKIARLSTVNPKIEEIKEESVGRSVKKEVNDKASNPRMISTAPKREIKEETREERKEKDLSRSKMKKARPAEELVRERKMLEAKKEIPNLEVKKEIKEEDIITID
ncbi:hypothetical protein PENTCL1PPCAC_18316, partial [Pristionchus entomophagus]